MSNRNLIAAIAGLFLAFSLSTALSAQEPDQVTPEFLAGAHQQFHSPAAVLKAKAAATSTAGIPLVTTAASSGIPGIDSIPNFTGSYHAAGYDALGNPNNTWSYAMVGAPPESGKTTVFNAPIIPVSLDLRNADGSPRFVNGQRLFYDATQYVQPVLKSPVFSKARYTSSEAPTQFTDAVQLAAFGDEVEDNWHNLLAPSVKTPRVMTLLAGTYYFALNANGSCCAFVLIDENTFGNELFPPTYPVDNTTVIGAAELAGDMTTKDISTLLFPNAYLYANGNPNDCCVLGYHSFDYEPGIPANGNVQRFYVMNYSSWISPGLFGAGTEDVTALSHEMSETFNDPFVVFDGVHDLTPWWLSPNGNCPDSLEVGDVIEGLPNATYPMTMHGYTYHPQNEALLPWFEFKAHSSAIHHAYSYPDETVLTSLSPVEKAGCAP
jgi:hypothetical protein